MPRVHGQRHKLRLLSVRSRRVLPRVCEQTRHVPAVSKRRREDAADLPAEPASHGLRVDGGAGFVLVDCVWKVSSWIHEKDAAW